jgi:hypothetical protein
MKLREFIAVAAIGLLASCETPYRATDTTVVVAPTSLQDAFVLQYPTAKTVVWSHYDPAVVMPIDWEMAGWTVMDNNDYVVTFKINEDDYYAWYDDAGNWIGTAYAVRDFTGLPTSITNAANNAYPGYTISSVHREFMKDRMVYEVEMKNSTTKAKLLIDESGNILKQKTKAND